MIPWTKRASAQAPDGETLDLTRQEFDLLLYLAQRPDTVVSKQELLAEVTATVVSAAAPLTVMVW